MIYTTQFSLASAITAAVFWSICSLMVALIPESMMQMTAHMLHVNLAYMTWTLTWSGFLLGLLSWSAFSGAVGLVLALVYKRLSPKKPI